MAEQRDRTQLEANDSASEWTEAAPKMPPAVRQRTVRSFKAKAVRKLRKRCGSSSLPPGVYDAIRRRAAKVEAKLRASPPVPDAKLRKALDAGVRAWCEFECPRPFQTQVVVRPGQTRLFVVTAATTGEALEARVRTDTGLKDFYLVHGGRPVGSAEALGALGVGANSSIEVKLRGRGGMGCGASKGDAGPAPGSVDLRGATLTVKQRAEKQREAEAIAQQLAKPSKWDKDCADLKAALADTVLVDAAWLGRLADEGGVLPRCQDLPPGARVTLEEMEKWQRYTVGALVVSYPW